MLLVVNLWVKAGKVADFEAFEKEAARIMARHGGKIERAVRLNECQDDRDAPFEVHLIRFPNEKALAAYQDDPETMALSAKRDAVIARTEICKGVEVEGYAG